MTEISVTAQRIKKGKKTYIEVRGLGANRDATILLGGKRAERAAAVVVCEREPLAADDPRRGDYYTFEKFPNYGGHPLHAIGLRADIGAARAEAARLVNPKPPASRRNRFGYRYDNSGWRPAAYAAAIEIQESDKVTHQRVCDESVGWVYEVRINGEYGDNFKTLLEVRRAYPQAEQRGDDD